MWLLEVVLFVSVLQREKEYYLQKLTTVSAVCVCVCVCVCIKEKKA